ncbi:MAG: hypothetical protein RLZZ37_1111 [Actinomycetota bacterium]|jgi:hypothetical protein
MSYQSPNLARSLFRTKPVPNSKQDRILGALMGAAIGDVMGSCLQGKSKEEITSIYGEKGITAPPHDSLISHNFQLVLFAIDALIVNARKNKKLSITEISNCLLKARDEWTEILLKPRFIGDNKDNINNICSNFMKNHPLWKVKRKNQNYLLNSKANQIVPLAIALFLFANERTSREVIKELNKKLGFPEVDLQISNVLNLFGERVEASKEVIFHSMEEIRIKINNSKSPALEGLIGGFEQGAHYGIKGFKNLWYLRIDAINLIEQMGWQVGRFFGI